MIPSNMPEMNSLDKSMKSNQETEKEKEKEHNTRAY
jgi:hypothetical protein